MGIALEILQGYTKSLGNETGHGCLGEGPGVLLCFHNQPSRSRGLQPPSLELSPSVESCGCGLGPSPVRLGSDAERDWGQEEKGMTEDEMAGWHH